MVKRTTALIAGLFVAFIGLLTNLLALSAIGLFLGFYLYTNIPKAKDTVKKTYPTGLPSMGKGLTELVSFIGESIKKLISAEIPKKQKSDLAERIKSKVSYRIHLDKTEKKVAYNIKLENKDDD